MKSRNFAIFLFAWMMFTSCASILEPDSGQEILSKSREEQPAWSKQKRGVLIRTPESLDYVTKGYDILNLPLGIKTAQLTALDSSRVLFCEETLAEIKKNATDPLKSKLDSTPKTQEIIRDIAKRKYSEQARIADIYFEQYRSNKKIGSDGKPQDLYKVFILASVPSTTVPQVIAAAVLQLSKSPDAESREIAGLLKSLTLKSTH